MAWRKHWDAISPAGADTQKRSMATATDANKPHEQSVTTSQSNDNPEPTVRPLPNPDLDVGYGNNSYRTKHVTDAQTETQRPTTLTTYSTVTSNNTKNEATSKCKRKKKRHKPKATPWTDEQRQTWARDYYAKHYPDMAGARLLPRGNTTRQDRHH